MNTKIVLGFDESNQDCPVYSFRDRLATSNIVRESLPTEEDLKLLTGVTDFGRRLALYLIKQPGVVTFSFLDGFSVSITLGKLYPIYEIRDAIVEFMKNETSLTDVSWVDVTEENYLDGVYENVPEGISEDNSVSEALKEKDPPLSTDVVSVEQLRADRVDYWKSGHKKGLEEGQSKGFYQGIQFIFGIIALCILTFIVAYLLSYHPTDVNNAVQLTATALSPR